MYYISSLLKHPDFNDPEKKKLFENSVEKEKMLITSNFSFSQRFLVLNRSKFDLFFAYYFSLDKLVKMLLDFKSQKVKIYIENTNKVLPYIINIIFFVLKITVVYQEKIYHRCYCMGITLVERQNC